MIRAYELVSVCAQIKEHAQSMEVCQGNSFDLDHYLALTSVLQVISWGI